MSGVGNFIQRWARLKHASDTAHEIETGSANVETTTAQPRTEGAPDQPFDSASLPSLESIAADTDIGAFLKSGVPAELTRAALRRVWSSDPAIRDFIGIAENQWDFNDPEGIPGFGPLPATDGAPSVLAQVTGKPANLPEALRELPVSVELDRSRVTDPKLTPNESCFDEPGVSDSVIRVSEPAEATKRDRAVEECDVSRNRRRHGSALPR
jgi:Protein of unknown function (DUF3306)